MTRRTLLIVATTAGLLVAALVVAVVLITRPSPATSNPTPHAHTTPTTSSAVPEEPSPTNSAAQPSASTAALQTPTLTIGREGPARLNSHQLVDADTVALTAAGGLSAFDAVNDSDQHAAARRIEYLLTDDLVSRYTTPAQDGPSGQWQAWTYTQSWATVTAQLTELPWALPADTGTSAIRVVLIQREVHSGQRVTPDSPVTLQLTLGRAAKSDPWRVNTIEVP